MLQDETNVERLESSIERQERGWDNMPSASSASIIQPDCILPAQVFGRHTPAGWKARCGC
jgi:hypothetical protein